MSSSLASPVGDHLLGAMPCSRSSNASTCTPIEPSAPMTVPDSSGSAATCYVYRSLKNAWRDSPHGRVGCTLAHAWHDGTRHLIFTPLEFLERLATITPRPQINVVL